MSTRTRFNLSLTQELCRWARLHKPGFRFTTIQLNRGYASEVHTDSGNVGPSMIVSFGRFAGGRLWIADEEQPGRGHVVREIKRKLRGYPAWQPGMRLTGSFVNIKEKALIFDGTRPRGTEEFAGERYSAVFFVHRAWRRASAEVVQRASDFGFPLPR